MARLDAARFVLHLPPAAAGDGLDQDEEWCEIERDGARERIRLHDYAAIFDVPGLYEQLFAEMLECDSPEVVCRLLDSELIAADVDPASLRALDFGAGNGMVGEQLAAVGVESIVGLDLLPQARDAALRDRPGLYDDYYAADVTDLARGDRRELEGRDFNAMVCVAALGFGDIPPAAFAEAFDLVRPPGWVAFNLRDRFIDDDDPAGFGAFVGRMFDDGVLEEQARVSYTHRVSVTGEPLQYSAIVARKPAGVTPAAALTEDY
jgi:SAM-dependent methyltransferase